MHWLAVEIALADKRPLCEDARAKHPREHECAIERECRRKRRLQVLQLLLQQRKVPAPLLVARRLRAEAPKPVGRSVREGQVAAREVRGLVLQGPQPVTRARAHGERLCGRRGDRVVPQAPDRVRASAHGDPVVTPKDDVSPHNMCGVHRERRRSVQGCLAHHLRGQIRAELEHG